MENNTMFRDEFLVSPKDVIRVYEDNFGLDKVAFKESLNKSRFLGVLNSSEKTKNKKTNDFFDYLERKNYANDLSEYVTTVEKIEENSEEYLKYAKTLYQVLSVISKDYDYNKSKTVDNLFSNTQNNKICIVEMLKEDGQLCGIDFIANELTERAWIHGSKHVAKGFLLGHGEFVLTTKNKRFQLTTLSAKKTPLDFKLMSDLDNGHLTLTDAGEFILGSTLEGNLVYSDLSTGGIHIFGGTGVGKSAHIHAILESLNYMNPKNAPMEVEFLHGDRRNDISSNDAMNSIEREILNRSLMFSRFGSELFKEKNNYKIFVIDEFNFGDGSEGSLLNTERLIQSMGSYVQSAKDLKIFFITSSFTNKFIPKEYLNAIGQTIVLQAPNFSNSDKLIPETILQQYKSSIKGRGFGILQKGNSYDCVTVIPEFIEDIIKRR